VPIVGVSVEATNKQKTMEATSNARSVGTAGGSPCREP
jgi:hypothetical protein